MSEFLDIVEIVKDLIRDQLHEYKVESDAKFLQLKLLNGNLQEKLQSTILQQQNDINLIQTQIKSIEDKLISFNNNNESNEDLENIKSKYNALAMPSNLKQNIVDKIEVIEAVTTTMYKYIDDVQEDCLKILNAVNPSKKAKHHGRKTKAKKCSTADDWSHLVPTFDWVRNLVNDKEKQLETGISGVKNQMNEIIEGKCGQINSQLIKYESHTFTWKINGISDIVKEDIFEYESEVFPVIGYQLQAQAKLQIFQDEKVFLSLAFIDEQQTGKRVPVKLLPSVTYTLKDLHNTDKDNIRKIDHLFTSSINFGQFSFVRHLYKSLFLNPTYNLDDLIVIDIGIDQPSAASSHISTDGVLAGEINNYTKSKQRLVDGTDVKLQYSGKCPYFYTSPNGYRVKVRMWLNGYGTYKGKGLTAVILFLTGENDLTVRRSFPHRTTFILFNQVDPTKHLIKSVETNVIDTKSYPIDILTHEEIENEGFLKDDHIYYKVFIEAQ